MNVNFMSINLTARKKPTCRIAATLTRLIVNISLTSLKRVVGEGTITLLLRSVRISMNSGSATMANGRWRRTAHNASFMRNFGAEYEEPCANAAMAWAAAESTGSQLSAWRTRLLVLSSCRARDTLMEGWLRSKRMAN